MFEERLHDKLLKSLGDGELLPKSLAIWLTGFQKSEQRMLREGWIEKVWMEEVLYYKVVRRKN